MEDLNGQERTVRYRRVPGYYNRSTYWVDVDGKHIGKVKRVKSATWNSPALWRGYDPEESFSVTDSTRERAVKTLLGRLKRKTAPNGQPVCTTCGGWLPGSCVCDLDKEV
jgi:hypothetical protein